MSTPNANQHSLVNETNSMTNYKYRIDVPRLRRAIFGVKCQKIPAETFGEYRASVCNTRDEYIGHMDVIVNHSSTIGSTKGGYRKDRNWLGTGKHRMHVNCPICGLQVPAGRLGQHVGYKHPEA